MVKANDKKEKKNNLKRTNINISLAFKCIYLHFSFLFKKKKTIKENSSSVYCLLAYDCVSLLSGKQIYLFLLVQNIIILMLNWCLDVILSFSLFFFFFEQIVVTIVTIYDCNCFTLSFLSFDFQNFLLKPIIDKSKKFKINDEKII